MNIEELTPMEEDQNEVFSYIVTEVIETLNLDYDEEELDYETLEFLVFEFMRELNEGTKAEIIIAKMRNQFLLSGIEPEDGELEKLMENIQSQCAQHLLAMRIAQQSFEDGETSETVLPKVMQIID